MEVRVLVVCRIYLGQTALADNKHHGLALPCQLVDVYLARIGIEDIILLYELHHLVQRLAVENKVGKLLVIADGAVIDTDITDFHVGLAAVGAYEGRGVLTKIVTAAVDVGLASDTVDVEFHQTALTALADNEGHLQPLLGGELHGYTHRSFHRAAIGRGDTLRAARVHGGFLGGNPEAPVAVHTADDRCLAVHHIAHTELELEGGTRAAHIVLQRSVTDGHLRTVDQAERAVKPAAGLPVHTLEDDFHRTVAPGGRVLLLVAAPGGIELQAKALGGLADVDTALHDIDIERIFSTSADELHRILSLGEEAVAVHLCGTGHTHTLRDGPIAEDDHRGRGGTGIVHDKVKGELLVLPHLDTG